MKISSILYFVYLIYFINLFDKIYTDHNHILHNEVPYFFNHIYQLFYNDYKKRNYQHKEDLVIILNIYIYDFLDKVMEYFFSYLLLHLILLIHHLIFRYLSQQIQIIFLSFTLQYNEVLLLSIFIINFLLHIFNIVQYCQQDQHLRILYFFYLCKFF